MPFKIKDAPSSIFTNLFVRYSMLLVTLTQKWFSSTRMTLTTRYVNIFINMYSNCLVIFTHIHWTYGYWYASQIWQIIGLFCYTRQPLNLGTCMCRHTVHRFQCTLQTVFRTQPLTLCMQPLTSVLNTAWGTCLCTLHLDMYAHGYHCITSLQKTTIQVIRLWTNFIFQALQGSIIFDRWKNL